MRSPKVKSNMTAKELKKARDSGDVTMEEKKRVSPRERKHRKEREMLARSAETLDRFLAGYDYRTIARQMGISIATVSRDIKLILNERMKYLDGQIELHRQRLAETYWKLFQENIKAWEKSRDPKKKTRRIERTRGGNQRTKTVEVTAEMIETDGEPRYMSNALQAAQALAKLCGLNAPDKIAPVSPSGEEPWQPDLSQLSDREIEQYRRMIKKVGLLPDLPTTIPISAESA